MFTSYADICHFLDELGLFHMDLSLSRVENALMKLCLDNPPFVAVQVVGTKGKGSTSTFLESLARAHGLRTGLFTSPHFITPSERIHIQGQPLPLENWPGLANQVHKAAPSLTYFEFLTVLSMLAFAEANVDIAIIEAGLGGHYDATTAIQRHALCLSPISLDHESVLGATVLAIAKDKAHAMAKDMPVFLGRQEPQVASFLEEFAKERQAQLIPIQQHCVSPTTALGLHGKHQQENAALAVTAWQWLAEKYAWSCTQEHIQEGLKKAFIAGRLHHIYTQEDNLPAHLLLDGAHNTQGLEVLHSYIQQLDTKPQALIFSCLADKNIQGMLPLLKKIHALCDACPLYLTDIQNNSRALNEEEKKALAQELGENIHLTHSLGTSLKLAQALTHPQKKAKNSNCQTPPVLLCGSLYLLGEFFEMYPHYLMNTGGI